MIWTRLFRARGGCGPSARAHPRTPMFRIEPLEDRSVPAIVATPNAFGGINFNPFPTFTGPVETASADVNGDGVPDIIAAQGAGPGSGSEVRIFDGAAARQGQAVPIADFFAYSNTPGASQTPGFAGGVFVAAADFNRNGFAEVVTSTGAGGLGHVKVFDFHDPLTGQFLGSDPILRTSFIAYPGFLGDVRVAAVNRGTNLTPLLVTASGAGTTQADVRVYDNVSSIGSLAFGTAAAPAAQMFVFPGYLGGVSIAPGGTTGNPLLYLAPTTGSPLISAFNLNTSTLGGVTLTPSLTFATGNGTATDIRLGSADLTGNGNLDALTSFFPATNSTPILAYSLADGALRQLPGLTGLQGFGFFGNSWLASSTFTGPSPTTGTVLASSTAVALPSSTPALGVTNFGGTAGSFSSMSGTGFGGTAGSFTPISGTATPGTAVNTGLGTPTTSVGLNSGLGTGLGVTSTSTAFNSGLSTGLNTLSTSVGFNTGLGTGLGVTSTSSSSTPVTSTGILPSATSTNVLSPGVT